jgi:hypothetical protein
MTSRLSAQSNLWLQFEADRPYLNPISNGKIADQPFDQYQIPATPDNSNDGMASGGSTIIYTNVIANGIIRDGLTGQNYTNNFSLYFPALENEILTYNENHGQVRPRNTSWSVETYFRADNSMTNFQKLFVKSSGVGSTVFNAQFNTNGKLLFSIRDTDGTENPVNLSSLSALNDDQWHQFAATLDKPSNTLRVYVDGVLNDSTTTFTGGNGILEDINVVIGISSGTIAAQRYKGFIDDFRFVSGMALSPGQFIVPEPTSCALLLGSAAVFWLRRRSK